MLKTMVPSKIPTLLHTHHITHIIIKKFITSIPIVLFKNLNVDLKEVSPSSLLMDKVREVEGNPDFSNKMSGKLNHHQWLEKLKKQIELLLEIIVIYSKKVLEREFKLMTLLHINLINRLYNEMKRIIMGRRLSINLMNTANVPFQHFVDKIGGYLLKMNSTSMRSFYPHQIHPNTLLLFHFFKFCVCRSCWFLSIFTEIPDNTFLV
uniref:Uncharacterized protein n=1 Tax=Lactuca sativa TaxID=4236 RepID=A0A9R1XU22_LACSA|nr:hypothetical protein LSAT_V11C200072380 [Lactuca sativa]